MEKPSQPDENLISRVSRMSLSEMYQVLEKTGKETPAAAAAAETAPATATTGLVIPVPVAERVRYHFVHSCKNISVQMGQTVRDALLEVQLDGTPRDYPGKYHPPMEMATPPTLSKPYNHILKGIDEGIQGMAGKDPLIILVAIVLGHRIKETTVAKFSPQLVNDCFHANIWKYFHIRVPNLEPGRVRIRPFDHVTYDDLKHDLDNTIAEIRNTAILWAPESL